MAESQNLDLEGCPTPEPRSETGKRGKKERGKHGKVARALAKINNCSSKEILGRHRITRLKQLTVKVKAGRAVRRYKVVKSDGPGDLVFQSVRKGSPIRDNNILVRFLKPAGRALGMPWVNLRCLRTSHATWLKMAGADIKDAQAQMGHSRASTTLDIYQQFVPESRKRVVERLSTLSHFIN